MFERIWQAGLQEYDELEGIAWEWQSMDGVMTKAPFGGVATGANPTDRGKQGTKRSQLSDGRGMPLAVVVDGANRTDMKLAEATLDGHHDRAPDSHEGAATACVSGCWL